VDGVTKEEYGQYLEENLQGLHACMKAKRYRHQPIRRVYIRRIQGHLNYFGVSGNSIRLLMVIEQVKRAWYKWLCSRSQRKRLT
jgi:retron-type reverse transcriptase